MLRGEEIEAFKVADGLTEEQAFDIEAKLIGEAPSGQLWNIAHGGEGLTSEVAAEVNRRPEKRASAGAKIKALWADPAWREKSLSARKPITDEAKAARSLASQALWSSPDHRARMSALHAKLHADPERKAKTSATSKAKMTPDHQRKMAEASASAKRTPEARAKQAEASRRRWADPDFRQMMADRAASRKAAAPQ